MPTTDRFQRGSGPAGKAFGTVLLIAAGIGALMGPAMVSAMGGMSEPNVLDDALSGAFTAMFFSFPLAAIVALVVGVIAGNSAPTSIPASAPPSTPSPALPGNRRARIVVVSGEIPPARRTWWNVAIKWALISAAYQLVAWMTFRALGDGLLALALIGCAIPFGAGFAGRRAGIPPRMAKFLGTWAGAVQIVGTGLLNSLSGVAVMSLGAMLLLGPMTFALIAGTVLGRAGAWFGELGESVK